MSTYYPGKLSSVGLHVCRLGSAQPEWLRSSSSFSYDRDISASYHESLAHHLLGCVHGINTACILWGDRDWYSGMANADVFHVVDGCIQHLRSPRPVNEAQLRIYKMVFMSHIYDCGTGALHDVSRRELVSAESSSLKQILPAADNRCILIVRLVMLLNDFEASITILVPPPHDDCTWDVHSLLRRQDDNPILSMNCHSLAVFHTTHPDRPSDEVLLTLQRIKQRICAPIPNTQAAIHLIQSMNSAHQQAPLAQPGEKDFGKQRADELFEELRAMEGELVAVRAAYVAASEKCLNLERAMNRSDPEAAKPLLIDPAAVNRELLRVCEELLRRINVDFIDLERRVMVMEKQTGMQPEAKVRALLYWRQQASETLLNRLSEAPLTVVSGQGQVLPLRAKLASHTPSGPNHSHAPDVTQGSKFSVDPLVQLYEARLVELENEVARMVDVDIKACIDEYYVKELALAERELLEWMTRARAAEEQRDVFEKALKAK